MKKGKGFLKTCLKNGMYVLLPITIVYVLYLWFFHFVKGILQPLIDLAMDKLLFPEWLAFIAAMFFVLMLCAFIGAVIKTGVGKIFQEKIERCVLQAAPLYTTIKGITKMFAGKDQKSFSSVALAKIFCSEALATCFIVDCHESGFCTIFVPTGPNPTTGFICHLPQKYVYPVDVPMEEAMRTIIGCGAGSGKLLAQYDLLQRGIVPDQPDPDATREKE